MKQKNLIIIKFGETIKFIKLSTLMQKVGKKSMPSIPSIKVWNKMEEEKINKLHERYPHVFDVFAEKIELIDSRAWMEKLKKCFIKELELLKNIVNKDLLNEKFENNLKRRNIQIAFKDTNRLCEKNLKNYRFSRSRR